MVPKAMSRNYTANFVHCIFSTKDRRDTIPPELQERLWSYLSGITKKLGCGLLAVGGTANHVHILLQKSGIAFDRDQPFA